MSECLIHLGRYSGSALDIVINFECEYENGRGQISLTSQCCLTPHSVTSRNRKTLPCIRSIVGPVSPRKVCQILR